METKRAAIYVRISADAHGEGLGVARQEEDARALCARRGWTITEVYSDNDRSAYSRKGRPAYNALCQAIVSNQVDVIVAWHPDRLHRQMRELVHFIDLVEEHNVAVETVTAGRLDLSTPSGRMTAKIVGSVAEYESEHKSARIKRKLQANAAEGLHHGGSRPYGWMPDRVTLDPREADFVRMAARLALSGESVRAVARALNEAGAVTSRGCPWSDVTVRDMLLRYRNAGIRIHHGEPVGPGQWEPILDEATLLQVRTLLTDPKRVKTPGRNGASYMLSTIARCGVCGDKITSANSQAYKGRSIPVYRCRAGHVSRSQVAVDDLVSGVLVARLEAPDARALLTGPAPDDSAQHVAKARLLRERLDGAASAYASGVLTLAQLETVTRELRPQIDAEEAAAAAPARSKALEPLTGSRSASDAWAALSTAQRRAIVAELIDVEILRSRSGRTFDPSTVRITWR